MTFDEAYNKYYDRFNEFYPLHISVSVDKKKVISEIEECLKTGKKKQDDFEEKEGCDY